MYFPFIRKFSWYLWEILAISFHTADEESAISDRILRVCVSRKNLHFCSWCWLVSSEACASDRKLLQQPCFAAFFCLLGDHLLIIFKHKFESAASNINIPGLQGITYWSARKLLASMHQKNHFLVYYDIQPKFEHIDHTNIRIVQVFIGTYIFRLGGMSYTQKLSCN